MSNKLSGDNGDAGVHRPTTLTKSQNRTEIPSKRVRIQQQNFSGSMEKDSYKIVSKTSQPVTQTKILLV